MSRGSFNIKTASAKALSKAIADKAMPATAMMVFTCIPHPFSGVIVPAARLPHRLGPVLEHFVVGGPGSTSWLIAFADGTQPRKHFVVEPRAGSQRKRHGNFKALRAQPRELAVPPAVRD